MKLPQALTQLLLLAMATASASASVPLGAPRKAPGGKFDMFGCIQTNAYYIVNFAAYQREPDRRQGSRSIPSPECIDLPRIGQTDITIDLLDRDLRHKEVAVKVFRGDGQIVAQTAPTIAKKGVISTQADFKSPGKYDVVVYVNDTVLNVDPEVGALRIPLAVAFAREVPPPKSGLTGVFVLIGAVTAALGFFVPRWLKPEAAA
jgi:hypothetical protein